MSKQMTMVAIYPSEEFLNLADKHAHPDEIARGLHLTLYYVGETSPEDDTALITALKHAMSGIRRPLRVYCNGPACFMNEDATVRLLLLNGVGLDIWRYQVLSHMWRAGYVGKQSHGFIPHMTLQYHEDKVLPDNWERCASEPYPEFDVDRLYLVRSNQVVAQVGTGGIVTLGGDNPSLKRLR